MRIKAIIVTITAQQYLGLIQNYINLSFTVDAICNFTKSPLTAFYVRFIVLLLNTDLNNVFYYHSYLCLTIQFTYFPGEDHQIITFTHDTHRPINML